MAALENGTTLEVEIVPRTYIPPWDGGILGWRPYRSQSLPKSVHSTRVGAHRSQPFLKSVHGIGSGPIAHSLARVCTVLGSVPIAHSFPEERARYSGRRPSLTAFPEERARYRVVAHRSQPFLKSVHGIGSAPISLTAFPEERARYSGRRPKRSQPFLKSVHGTWVGAHRSQSFLKSVHKRMPRVCIPPWSDGILLSWISSHGPLSGYQEQRMACTTGRCELVTPSEAPLQKCALLSPRICIAPWVGGIVNDTSRLARQSVVALVHKCRLSLATSETGTCSTACCCAYSKRFTVSSNRWPKKR